MGQHLSTRGNMWHGNTSEMSHVVIKSLNDGRKATYYTSCERRWFHIIRRSWSSAATLYHVLMVVLGFVRSAVVYVCVCVCERERERQRERREREREGGGGREGELSSSSVPWLHLRRVCIPCHRCQSRRTWPCGSRQRCFSESNPGDCDTQRPTRFRSPTTANSSSTLAHVW
jgi:hypothetical protein